jgi:hypothetical protein
MIFSRIYVNNQMLAYTSAQEVTTVLAVQIFRNRSGGALEMSVAIRSSRTGGARRAGGQAATDR